MPEQTFKPSDFMKTAGQLKADGKLPELEDLLKAVAETRAEYADKIKAARHQEQPGIAALGQS